MEKWRGIHRQYGGHSNIECGQDGKEGEKKYGEKKLPENAG